MALSFCQNFESHTNHKPEDTDKTWLCSFLSERLVRERSILRIKENSKNELTLQSSYTAIALLHIHAEKKSQRKQLWLCALLSI